jgi:hypothetical protein
MVNALKIQNTWLPRHGDTEVDVTLCRLQIEIGERNITEYSAEHRDGSGHLEIPVYYLAEWMAENWWPLMWEPRKDEEAGDDRDFLARHSFLTAQHGFALPKVLIVPIGKNVQVSAVARNVQFTDVRFRNGGSVVLPRQAVKSELKRFVGSVAERLMESGITGTAFQEAWELVTGTEPDQRQFCQLMGALGHSPYVPNPHIENMLERLVSLLGEHQVLDLCLAASPANFSTAARAAEFANTAMSASRDASLEPLATISVPPDNPLLPAWRRGVQAAKRVRAKLGIEEMDPLGGQILLDKLKIDLGRALSHENEPEPASIVGAVSRKEQCARIALLQAGTDRRRFSAARAAYLAWSAEDRTESRLMTNAVTRDQQASRAFAAETLIPFAYIRSQAKSSTLPQHLLYDIASNANVEIDVVKKQAQNSGLQIASI